MLNDVFAERLDLIKKRPVIAIIGPTASGKTSLSVKLAREIGGEVISADSAQIYREPRILTACVTPEEAEGVPHHLVSFLDLGEEFSVADFQRLAYERIDDILGRGKIPILCGGTMLYVKAVLEAYLLPDIPVDVNLRRRLNEKSERLGKKFLYDELMEKDPAAAVKIDVNNVRRVIRALEVIEKSGKLFSELYKKISPHPLGINSSVFCITLSREELYRRIDKRVDIMMEAGALEEIENLVRNGKKDILMESKILGCREMVYILEGISTRQEGIDLLKRNTRKYSKRQLTWFRSMEGVQPLEMDENFSSSGIIKILELLKRKFLFF